MDVLRIAKTDGIGFEERNSSFAKDCVVYVEEV